MNIPRSKIIYPDNGGLNKARKAAIESAKTGVEAKYIGLADGRIEVYIGTSHNKQGYFKMTCDPIEKRKRPGIPQYTLSEV